MHKTRRTLNMRGLIISDQRFLFPDTPLGKMPDYMRVISTQNGKIGLQIIFDCPEENGTICVEAEGFHVEYYQMVDVPVEFNSGNGVDQGGAMTLLLDHCPEYAIRQAPFRVLDCLRPMENGKIPSHNGRTAAYVCISPEAATGAGTYHLHLTITVKSEEHLCDLECKIYPVRFEESKFHQTNWFNLLSMAEQHNLEPWSPEHYEMIRAYAKTMRRAHQNVFCIWFDDVVKISEKPYHFDFSAMKPLLDIFIDEGFDTLETGSILTRGTLPDGSPDMYTKNFACNGAPNLHVDSDQGYEFLSCELKDFADFLRQVHWNRKVLFHIIDEPDVHYRTDEDLEARRMQYFMAANLVRRYIPNVQTIEAVKTTKFRGGIDIMVPITDGYQKNKEAFDTAISLGDPVWSYVCCGPEGNWLNRFLDQPLINGRLLFWGFALNRISGYLHWGYNQFQCTPNPFQNTRGKNETGIGTDFPCGDAFIVYPGNNGPWLSMRLEAERRGAEEADLLLQLCDQNPERMEQLILKVFQQFDLYNNDPVYLEEVYEQLLQELSLV